AVNGLDNDVLSVRDAVPDTTPPEVVAIGFDTGTVVPAGTTVTYSITFDEAVNAASLHAGSFINAGTAAISIRAIRQPAANVITVQVTPTTTGTLLLALPAGAITDVAGNPTAIAFSDDIAINVVPPPPPPGLIALVNFVHRLGNRARLGFGDVNGD